MPVLSMKNTLVKLVAFTVVWGISVVNIGGCRKTEEKVNIDLPATPVLTIQAKWGLVKASYLRVRKEPDISSGVVDHLRIGSLAEILSKTDSLETIEDESDYWYEIYSNGIRGWVFGAYLDFFDSIEEARAAARKYN